MQILEGKVRLGGSLLNEVRKDEMSAAEVIALRDIHGQDAIVDLYKVTSKKTDHAAERDRLAKLYGWPRIERLFGPAHQQLPIECTGVEKRPEGSRRPSIEEIAE